MSFLVWRRDTTLRRTVPRIWRENQWDGPDTTPHHTAGERESTIISKLLTLFWKKGFGLFLLCLSEPPHSIYIYYYYGSFIIYIITITREGVITRGSYCWILRRDRRHRANVFTVGSCVTSMCLYFYFKEESRRYETHICGTLVKLCLSFPWRVHAETHWWRDRFHAFRELPWAQFYIFICDYTSWSYTTRKRLCYCSST